MLPVSAVHMLSTAGCTVCFSTGHMADAAAPKHTAHSAAARKVWTHSFPRKHATAAERLGSSGPMCKLSPITPGLNTTAGSRFPQIADTSLLLRDGE